jgi:hypothetical protein
MNLGRNKPSRQRLAAGKILARLNKGKPMEIDRGQFRRGNIDRSICRSKASSFCRRCLHAHGFFYPGISPSLG